MSFLINHFGKARSDLFVSLLGSHAVANCLCLFPFPLAPRPWPGFIFLFHFFFLCIFFFFFVFWPPLAGFTLPDIFSTVIAADIINYQGAPSISQRPSVCLTWGDGSGIGKREAACPCPQICWQPAETKEEEAASNAQQFIIGSL